MAEDSSQLVCKRATRECLLSGSSVVKVAGPALCVYKIPQGGGIRGHELLLHYNLFIIMPT